MITRHKLVSFLKHQYNIKDIQLNNIQLSFAIDFEHYLSTVQKIGSNTSIKYVQNIKQILQMGIDFGLLQTNPIAAFKCGYQHPHRDRLTMDEIMLLRDKDLILRLVPPVTFFICCFTGYAYLDVYNLTPENINHRRGWK